MRIKNVKNDMTKSGLRWPLALFLTVWTPFASAEWVYAAFPDAMSGKEAQSAVLNSANSISLKFPYQGENHAVLAIRQDPHQGLIAYLQARKGQILCSSGCSVRVRFDSSPPMSVQGGPTGDGSSDTIFLKNPQRLISAAKKANKILVEVGFYQNGDQVFEFASFPLIWPIPDPKGVRELVQARIGSAKAAFGDESVSGDGVFCGKFALGTPAGEPTRRFIVARDQYADIEDVGFESLGDEGWKKIAEFQRQIAGVKSREGIDPKKIHLLALLNRWNSTCGPRYGGP